MAKKRLKAKSFSFQGFDARHYRTTEQYTKAVDSLFNRATMEIAVATADGTYNPDKPFSFADYPRTNAKVQSIVTDLANNITTVIEQGSRKQWLFACQKNDEFVESIMDTSKLSKARLNKMQDRNLDSLQTFQERKVDGMNLSERVWKYTKQYKAQIEQGLDVGLGEGRSAQQLSRDLRQNLREPDILFRRVRDKRGNLVLSKNARAFHPGQGVYRSSAKNAARLTRSEINMAYREADWLRWQQLDFVIGFEVHRSNRDPLPKCKMCDQLVGRYPKTFKFKGWHPQCMCFATAILMDEQDFDNQELSDLKSVLRGEPYKKLQVKNAVTDVPDGFKDWVAENTDKQANWGSTPYFIKDNFKGGVLANGLKNVAVKPIEPTRTLLSDMPEEEVQQWRSQWKIIENEFENIVHEFQKQGINYSFLEDLIGDALHTPRKESKYWRIDEAKAELLRLKKELKEKERQILQAVQVEFDNAIKELRNWVYFGDVQEAIDNKNPQLARTLIASKLAEKKRLQAEYNADILEAQNTIKEARKLKLNTTDLQSWLDYAKSDQREWIMGKTKFKGALKDLKTQIHLANNKGKTQNQLEVEKELGVQYGKEMTFEEANEQKGNPFYAKGGGYRINCQSCVVANELRRRGLDVQAHENTGAGSIPRKLSYHTELAWIDENGQTPKATRAGGSYVDGYKIKSKTRTVMMKEFYELVKPVGRYHISWGWKGSRSGHIITAERLADGTLRIYDPQTGQIITDWKAYASRFGLRSGIDVLRVDGLGLNTSIIKGVVLKSTTPK